MEEFRVKQGEFEGPLELLLDLIEKRKLHISDVSLASVTDDFINYVQRMEEYSIGGVAQFILVASTLLLIKSKSLLPNLSLTTEESADIEDLENRLKILQKMREASKHIKDRLTQNHFFMKSDTKLIEPIFSPEDTIQIPTLRNVLKDLINGIVIKEKLPEAIVKKVISIEEMIEKLVTRVQRSMRTSFKDFAGGIGKEKTTIIVGFLAMLELVKQGIVAVNQENHFGDIEIESSEVSVPRIV